MFMHKVDQQDDLSRELRSECKRPGAIDLWFLESTPIVKGCVFANVRDADYVVGKGGYRRGVGGMRDVRI